MLVCVFCRNHIFTIETDSVQKWTGWYVISYFHKYERKNTTSMQKRQTEIMWNASITIESNGVHCCYQIAATQCQEIAWCITFQLQNGLFFLLVWNHLKIENLKHIRPKLLIRIRLKSQKTKIHQAHCCRHLIIIHFHV